MSQPSEKQPDLKLRPEAATGVEVQIFDQFNQVKEAAWRAATPWPSIYVTPEWFRSVEGKLASPQRYVLSYDQQGQYASASLYFVTPKTYFFYNPIDLLSSEAQLSQLASFQEPTIAATCARLAERVRRSDANATICASPFGFTHALRQDASAANRRAIIGAIEETAHKWETEIVAILYADAYDTALGHELLERGYFALHSGANCVLSVPNDGFDGYLARFPKHRRKAFRRERRLFHEHGLMIRAGSLDEHIDALAHLQATLQAKYGHGYDADRQRIALLGIAEYLSDYVHLSLVERAGQLVGFELYYHKDGVLFPKMGGYDYEALNRDDFAYFNAAYYNLIERAAQLNANRIEYGRDAYDVKLERGCQLQPLVSYLKVPDAIRAEAQELAGYISDATQQLIHARTGEGGDAAD